MNQTRRVKKGDLIVVAGVWAVGDGANRDGSWSTPTVYTRRLRVESWGGQQATFTDIATGEFIRKRGYTDRFSFAFDGEDLAGIIHDAKLIVRDRLCGALRCQESWEENYGPGANAVVRASMKANKGKLESQMALDPRVADYNELAGGLVSK